jgi:hypothetical protein
MKKQGNRWRDGPLWLLLGKQVGLTNGLRQPSLFFFLLLFFFVLFTFSLAYKKVGITLHRLITYNEGSTTRHLKKSKGSREKDSGCNWARECGEQRTSGPRGKRGALKSRGERR